MTRRFKQTAEFANFICHFGSKELLDYLEEIILPTFLSTGHVRQYGTSTYFLHSVELTQLKLQDQQKAAIVGRFIVDTELSRAQVFRDNQIVPSPRTMDTAPSAVFAITLDDHKLMYSKEVSGGPSIAVFKSTLELLLNRHRLIYIEELFRLAKENASAGTGKHVTKKTIADSIPKPELEIVPLSGEAGIRDFLEQFKTLKELRIQVLKPNSEIDNDEFFEEIQGARASVNAESTTLIHRNPTGLKINQAAKQAAPAMSGNATVTFVGVGANEEKLSGTNEDFKIVKPIQLPRDVKQAGQLLIGSFGALIASGVIQLAQTNLSQANVEKLKKLFSV